MKTITIPGFIRAELAPAWRHGMSSVIDGLHYDWYTSEVSDGFKTVTPHALVFQVPDDFNPTAEAIAQLDAQEKDVLAKAESALNIIRERRNKLLALTNEAVEG